VLVCGGSGNLGRAVSSQLLGQGREFDIVIGSRHPEQLGINDSSSVTTMKVDFDDIDSLVAAFKGCDRLLLISPGSEPTRTRRVEWLTRAITVAERSRVGHVVYTSMRGAGNGAEATLFGEHDRIERALEASDLGWTVLRNSLYVDQFADSLPLALHYGKYSVSHPAAPIAYVTRADCARAAYHALVSDFSGRRKLEITGREAYSRVQLLDFLTGKSGRSVKAMKIELSELHDRLLRAGIWKHVADSLAEIESAVGAGAFACPSDDFLHLTGCEPQSAKDWLQDRLDWILDAANHLAARARTA
jgi:NAD(P)H dehydrogenase (quinone)